MLCSFNVDLSIRNHVTTSQQFKVVQSKQPEFITSQPLSALLGNNAVIL